MTTPTTKVAVCPASAFLAWKGRCIRAASVTVLMALGQLSVANGCTTIVVGKSATVDGSVMCTHTDDGGSDSDARLTWWPAADYPPGSLRNVYYGNTPARVCVCLR